MPDEISASNRPSGPDDLGTPTPLPDRFAHLRAGGIPRTNAQTSKLDRPVPSRTNKPGPAIAIGDQRPLWMRKDWHEKLLADFEFSGDLALCLRSLPMSLRDWEKACAKYASLKAEYEKIQKGLVTRLFGVGMEKALAGDNEMLRHYQKALDPRFADKRTVEHTFTARDRKLAEQMAIEAGVDPEKALATFESMRRKAGRGSHLTVVPKAS